MQNSQKYHMFLNTCISHIIPIIFCEIPNPVGRVQLEFLVERFISVTHCKDKGDDFKHYIL